MNLLSLFDGSGGFPLAAAVYGIEPVYASEVEPYPIAVTRSRLPGMKHLGDVSKVNGAEIDPVDVITFGSPCQDLSVAGLRKGMKHEENGDEETTRSGLFFEAIRIIKEMRNRDKASGRSGVDVRPRYIVWENVFGAFSSNNGRDFRAVLEEIIKIIEPTAVMPDVPKGGWAYADCYRGDGWSIAYRVFDAQYWGVPQRRRRIYLVADFGSECADQILFEREGVCRDNPQSREAWQGTPADAQRSPLADDREGEPCVISMMEAYSVENHPADSRVDIDESGTVQTLTSRMGTGGGNVPMVMLPFCKSARARSADDATTWKDGEVANTLNTFDTGEARANELVVEERPVYCLQGSMIGRADKNGPQGSGVNVDIAFTQNATDRSVVVYAVDQGGGKSQANVTEGIAPTLTCTHGGEPAVAYGFDPGASRDVGDLFIPETAKTLAPGTCPGHHDGVVIAFDRAAYNQVENARYDFEVTDSGVNSTIVAKGPSGVCYGVDAWNGTETPESIGSLQASAEHNINSNNTVRTQYIVRRLTPTECARLQGFPDRWGIPDHKDDMTAEEYGFWRDVRMTYDRINGRKEKAFTDAQILKWYNSLHNDGAEYKMWGNGIALPCALYIMRGIAEVMKNDRRTD
jgi:DNA (cytosine-5)-methyltransferase 1